MAEKPAHSNSFFICATILLILALSLYLAFPKLSALLSDEIRLQIFESQELKEARARLMRLEGEVSLLKRSMEKIAPKESPIVPVFFTARGSEKDDPFLGSVKSDLLLMQFVDYQCAPCRAFYKSVLPQVIQDYVDTGKAKFLLRDFPLENNSYSVSAAQFAHCAGEKGKYWDAYIGLFESPELVDNGAFRELSDKIPSISGDKFMKCFSSDRYQKEVDADIEDGLDLGVKGAPSLFVGFKIDENNFEGVLIRGAQPYGVIKSEIEKLLAKNAREK